MKARRFTGGRVAVVLCKDLWKWEKLFPPVHTAFRNEAPLGRAGEGTEAAGSGRRRKVPFVGISMGHPVPVRSRVCSSE